MNQHSRDCCKGKTVSMQSEKCPGAELRLFGSGKGRAGAAPAGLCPGALGRGSAHAQWVNHNQGVLGSAGRGTTEPLSVAWAESEPGPSLAPFRGVWLLAAVRDELPPARAHLCTISSCQSVPVDETPVVKQLPVCIKSFYPHPLEPAEQSVPLTG